MHYRIEVEGCHTFIVIEYNGQEILNATERVFVMYSARGHYLLQQDAYGDRPLLRVDDPYRLRSVGVAPPQQVDFIFYSLEPYRPTYTTALNALRGTSKFYLDPRRRGSMVGLVADRDISKKDDNVDVATIAVWPGGKTSQD